MDATSDGEPEVLGKWRKLIQMISDTDLQDRASLLLDSISDEKSMRFRSRVALGLAADIPKDTIVAVKRRDD